MIVDDNPQDQRVHAVTLRNGGYRVLTAGCVTEAMELVKTEVPDLFLIAGGMQEMDGFALCRRLKKDFRLNRIPVIFVTGTRDPAVIDQGFDAGGVDTIVKPCHLNEFLARVKIHLELSSLVSEVERLREADIDANPLTHLPGNNTIATVIQEAIDGDRDVMVIYTDLDDFKAYNDAYSFSSGDDVLLFNAETLQTALRLVTPEENFLGHIGGDDFVMIVPSKMAQQLGEKIVQLFDEGAPTFYKESDLASGGITARDRQGRKHHFPIMGISMGGVNLRSYSFTRFVEVAEICADVKHAAKQIPGSNLFIDRRGGCNTDGQQLLQDAKGHDRRRADRDKTLVPG